MKDFMNPRNKTIALSLGLAGLTIALGFFAWWTFIVVAFVSAFYFARKESVARPIVVAMLAPAIGWLIVAFIRDIHESGRISAKLATLLHVRFGFTVYLVLFMITLAPSFLAAFSGHETSKALR